jgi:hypothetical protein
LANLGKTQSSHSWLKKVIQKQQKIKMNSKKDLLENEKSDYNSI